MHMVTELQPCVHGVQDFSSLVSEYVHSVVQDTLGDDLKQAAGKTWNSLKRSTKAGPRRSVSAPAVGCFRTCTDCVCITKSDLKQLCVREYTTTYLVKSCLCLLSMLPCVQSAFCVECSASLAVCLMYCMLLCLTQRCCGAVLVPSHA